MDIVTDANIFIAILLNEPEKKEIIQNTEKSTIVSPKVLPYELGNALINLHRRNRLSESQLITAYQGYEKIPVRLVDIDIEKSILISMKYGIYAYDAYYLEVAKRLRLPLLTLDKKMKDIAKKMKIQLLKEII
ncbi:MAG: type II toxin-antitoxin system VapC family toxin [Spirochaetaceae bacterium]|nr:type II toxin-antitoxin system VapC family toxin [Spirochaetaceae bacterium]